MSRRPDRRDKEVGRLNKVIERLQEKTHAHVTAMNKELRASNEKCAAQSERLAVVGERLRVAETTLAISELGVGGDERSSRSRSTATAVEQPESPSLAARASEADAAELLQAEVGHDLRGVPKRVEVVADVEAANAERLAGLLVILRVWPGGALRRRQDPPAPMARAGTSGTSC